MMISNALVLLVALLHVWFMILEMYFWTRPLGRKAFGLTKESAEATKVMAQNQGIYNGFLAAGLIWGVVSGLHDVKIFFLACVIVAGIVGAFTANKKILYIQAFPALAALMAVVCL
ncbi:DUF1304 domain-containing protein [Peredibacter starrii]|uniref:DUF1304 domain-containing protein n=1 Tax=Peredibacter starrii TaxID=28202 RepID=A0AAX4HUG7_9BACT|nr:DUF1304 domain-containing protein [Peredibacter starrii]WPU67026.1 DUF1304 domain-containing protein [Peredibacter starrii]